MLMQQVENSPLPGRQMMKVFHFWLKSGWW